MEEIATKSIGLIAEMKRIGDESKTGKMSTSIQLMLFEKTAIPATLFNLETWTNWREKDLEELEKSQMKAIRNIFNLPKTTPSWGLMKEYGLWPMSERVVYKRLMTLQQIRTSQNGRLCRKVIENQKTMDANNVGIVKLKMMQRNIMLTLMKLQT